MTEGLIRQIGKFQAVCKVHLMLISCIQKNNKFRSEYFEKYEVDCYITELIYIHVSQLATLLNWVFAASRDFVT
jgi:hypothetical protein